MIILYSIHRARYPDLNDDEIDALLKCKKTHIGKIIYYTAKNIENIDFPLDIIKGSIEKFERPYYTMLRELSEEIMFKDRYGTLLDKNYVLDTLKKF